MKQNSLNNILEFIQEMPDTQQGEQVTAAILKIVADNAALKAKLNAPAAKGKKDKNYLKFTKQEIDSMPEPIKILLIYGGHTITYRYHNGVYHVRYRRDGYNIEVASKDLNVLKAKFIEKLSNYKPKAKEDKKYPLMKDFVEEWLNLKLITVKASTFKSYRLIIDAHVIPVFGNTRINLITRSDIQNYLTLLINDNKNRTAQKLKQLLSAIFDVAVEDYDIKNPMAKVALPHYESKKGCALTKAEEKLLVDYCIQKRSSACASAILVLLYTGMRAGELKSAILMDNHILCITEKTRKGYADVTRKIPITPMLRKVMQYIDFDAARKIGPDSSRKLLKEILPNHHIHDLRYTFITRAKEAGCNHELVMLWDGHKFDKDVVTSAVDRGYTTYSDEYYFKEAEKIDYEL